MKLLLKNMTFFTQYVVSFTTNYIRWHVINSKTVELI